MEKDPESKDFDKCRQDANNTLEANGAEVKDGVLYDKESGKPMEDYIKEPNLTPEQKAKAAESMVVFKQLANYDNIEGIRNHADYVNSQLILAKPGSPEYEQAQKDKTDTTEQLNAAYAKDKELVEERKSLNAVQSKQQTEQERQTEQEQLLGQIQALETAMQEVKDNQQNAVRWAELMAQYVGIQELTAENLNLLVERIEVYDRTETNAGAEQMIKICYRFGGYIGERVFSAKVLKHPCRKNACPLKERKGYGKISLVS